MSTFVEKARLRPACIGSIRRDGAASVAAPETTEQALVRFGAESGWSDAARLAGSTLTVGPCPEDSRRPVVSAV